MSTFTKVGKYYLNGSPPSRRAALYFSQYLPTLVNLEWIYNKRSLVTYFFALKPFANK